MFDTLAIPSPHSCPQSLTHPFFFAIPATARFPAEKVIKPQDHFSPNQLFTPITNEVHTATQQRSLKATGNTPQPVSRVVLKPAPCARVKHKCSKAGRVRLEVSLSSNGACGYHFSLISPSSFYVMLLIYFHPPLPSSTVSFLCMRFYALFFFAFHSFLLVLLYQPFAHFFTPS